MGEFAITVVSHDRPGLIADVTEVLARLGGNVQSSSMSLLQGHFAWTLVVSIEVDAEQIRAELLPVCPRGVTVLELDADTRAPSAPVDRVIVNVHGADRIGIVASITRAIADAGGNIVELTTHLAGGLYIVTAEVEFLNQVDVEALDAQLRAVGEQVGVTVSAHREDADLL